MSVRLRCLGPIRCPPLVRLQLQFDLLAASKPSADLWEGSVSSTGTAGEAPQRFQVGPSGGALASCLSNLHHLRAALCPSTRWKSEVGAIKTHAVPSESSGAVNTDVCEKLASCEWACCKQRALQPSGGSITTL